MRVAIIYWVFGIIWIYLSDYLLAKLFPDPDMLTRVQNYKGWFFVTASALLIYFLFRHYFSEQRQIQWSLAESEEKFRAVFESANVGKSLTKLNGEISAHDKCWCSHCLRMTVHVRGWVKQPKIA